MSAKTLKGLQTHVTCDCPRCRNVPTANKMWGYDEAELPGTHCYVCDQPIGAEPYDLNTLFARFGEILVKHERCKLRERRKAGKRKTA